MHNKTFGNQGEDLAASHLQDKGYIILKRNYRYKRSEIDLIASKDNLLVFVEVKIRADDAFGNPEEAVNNKKVEKVMEAAENYIDEINWNKEIRFDIISILKNKDKSFSITHIEDAFF